jgi:lipopolysaccharide export system permease protein
MMSLHQLKIATDSLDKMADLERDKIVKYGKRGVRYFSDSLLLLGPENSTTPFLSTLTRVERNNTFSKAKELSRSQMKGIENALEKVKGRTLRRDRHAIEWHRKFILAISCLVLFFVGASIGSLTRKGGLGMPVLLAIGVFLSYYIISMVGEQMVKSGTLSPDIGMWLSTIILVPFAILLTYISIRGGRQHLRIPSSIFTSSKKQS